MMQESKHTAGPLTVEPHGKYYALYSGRDNMRHGSNLVHLNEPDHNWEANAKLIASAPDMFRIIEQLANANWIGESEINRWRKECREIISKVTK